MKETKVKITPAFLRRPTRTNFDGTTSMEMVGSLPKGGRVVLTLEEMEPSVVKQLVKDGLKSLRTRRDRALQDVEEMRFEASQ